MSIELVRKPVSASGGGELKALSDLAILKNYLINSNFDFWQRGASFATPTTGSYLADRWRTDYDGTSGTFTIDRQAFTVGQTEVPNEPRYFLRWNQTVASSGSLTRTLQQLVEGVRTLAGQQVTVSFWAKADTSRTINFHLEQYFGSGGSPSALVSVVTTPVNLTTVWQKFVLTIDVPSILGKTLGTDNNDYTNIAFQMPNNVINTIDIAQVMVNKGSIAADWQLAGGGTHNLADELALCQRYYEIIITVAQDDNVFARDFYTGQSTGATAGLIQVHYRVEKRTFPTLHISSATHFAVTNNVAGAIATTSVVYAGNSNGKRSSNLFFTVAGGLTAGNATILQGANASAHLAANAEL